MILAPHNPAWTDEFRALEAVLTRSLHGRIVGIEHVGSTAVPGLRAKPTLDVDIVMAGYTAFSPIAVALRELGYAHNGDQGIAEREVFKRADEQVPWCVPRRTWMAHHLYVCPVHSRELDRHLRFRDALRLSAELRAEYEVIKVSIEARSANDRKIYTRIKEIEARAFVERVLREERSPVLDPADNTNALERRSTSGSARRDFDRSSSL